MREKLRHVTPTPSSRDEGEMEATVMAAAERPERSGGNGAGGAEPEGGAEPGGGEGGLGGGY